MKKKKIEEIKKIIKENSHSNTHDCYLMLTEGVNYNIIDFCSKQYKEDKKYKGVLTQVNSGFIPDNIWKSIIFQILVTLYVLKNEKIYFSEISLMNNIFIKRIDITPDNIKYWKYVINNVTYYVPNYGYLVMFDSNFSDNSILSFEEKEYNYLKIFDIPSDITIDSKIRKILEGIKDKTKNIDEVIFDNFYKYSCDKLGHFISDTSELQLIHHDKNFKYGDLVLYNKYSNIYVISCYTKDKIKTNNCNIKDYNESNIQLEEIVVSNDLIIKFKENITKEVIETYTITY